jgi:hypothetical protein
MSSPTKAPSHLSPVAQQWFKQIIFDYELESQHVRLLTRAARRGTVVCKRVSLGRTRPDIPRSVRIATSAPRSSHRPRCHDCRGPSMPRVGLGRRRDRIAGAGAGITQQ